ILRKQAQGQNPEKDEVASDPLLLIPKSSAPGLPRALKEGMRRSKGRRVVEVAALGLSFAALAAFAVAELAGAVDLGRGALDAGAALIGLQLGDRPLVALGGLPAALAQPPGDHHPVALAQGLGQVLSLPAPDVHLEERGVAVAPLAVLLDPLSHRNPHV